MANFLEIIIPLFLVFIFFIYMQRREDNTEVVLVRSSVDGREYIVQNKPDKQEAANALATVRADLMKFVQLLQSKNGKDPRVQRLVSKFNPDAISEGTEDARYTSYTLNKGEKMVFCLRTRDHADHVHRTSLLLFVAIHEIAHIATVSEGHTDEFNDNFKWLIERAVEYGIYTPENFRASPKKYCGIDVTDTPLDDKFF
jgi:hypothetical protein